jgi:hypothetical protein
MSHAAALRWRARQNYGVISSRKAGKIIPMTPLEKLQADVKIGIKEGLEAAAKLSPEEALRSSQKNIQDLRQRGILPPAKKKG